MAWLEEFAQDLSYGLRQMRRSPGFTAVAVLALALGIGANTAIFSLIDALMLRWLPVHKPGELVQVVWNLDGQQTESFSYPVIQALGARTSCWLACAASAAHPLWLVQGTLRSERRGHRLPEPTTRLSACSPKAGRLLTLQDDRPGAPLVAVISDSYWTRKFNRNPDIAGQVIVIADQAVTIVGVSPPGFTGANVGEVAEITSL